MKLYTAGHPIRFFLVPDDAEWPEGTDAVADVLGKSRLTDLAALASQYELPRDDALAWSRGERARIEADVLARDAERRERLEHLAADLEQRMAADGWDRERLAGLLAEVGLDLDRMMADQEGTARLFSEFVGVATRGGAGPDRRAVFPALAQVLRRHGYPEAATRLQSGVKRIERDLDELLAALSAASAP